MPGEGKLPCIDPSMGRSKWEPVRDTIRPSAIPIRRLYPSQVQIDSWGPVK